LVIVSPLWSILVLLSDIELFQHRLILFLCPFCLPTQRVCNQSS
jgi:hypothetical protein